MNEKQERKKEEPLLTHGAKGVCNTTTHSVEPDDGKAPVRRRDPLNSPGLNVPRRQFDPDDAGIGTIGARDY